MFIPSAPLTEWFMNFKAFHIITLIALNYDLKNDIDFVKHNLQQGIVSNIQTLNKL